MRLHEFRCQNCGKEFEEFLSSRSEQPACPSCNSSEVKRLLSAVKQSGSSKESAPLGSACSPAGGFS